jgi:hypothetical protein
MADYDISKLPHPVQQALMQLTEVLVQAWPSAASVPMAPVAPAPEALVAYEAPRAARCAGVFWRCSGRIPTGLARCRFSGCWALTKTSAPR